MIICSHCNITSLTQEDEKLHSLSHQLRHANESLNLAIQAKAFEIVIPNHQQQIEFKHHRLRITVALEQSRYTSPDVFIPIAEACGIIIELGRWIIESAICQLAQ